MISIFDYISIFLIFTVFLNSMMLFFIYGKGKKNINNISYGAVISFVVLWTISMFIYRGVTEEYVLFWCKMLYVNATLVSSSFLFFTYIFPYGLLRLDHIKTALIFFPNIMLVFLTFFSNQIIESVLIQHVGENTIIFGDLYLIYVLYILIYFFLGFWNLFNSYRQSSGIHRTQLWYVFIGFFVAANIAFTTNLVMPWRGDTSLNWVGQVATIIWVGFTTYAILRYRLMDIRVALSRGLIYIFSFVSVIFVGIFSVSAVEKIFPDVSQKILISFSLVIGVSLFKSIFEFFQNIAAKYFSYTFYNYQRVLADLGKSLTRVLEIEKLSSLITDTLADTMKLNRAVILIRDDKEGRYVIQKNIGFKEENGISLVKDNFLTNYLEKKQKPLVYEELLLIIRDSEDKKEREKIKKLQENMRRIEAALCLPLLIGDKISGMIVLGNKVSGDPYFEQDIDLLSGLSSQASIAFQNAKLYSEVQDLSQNLEKKVDEQVKELKKAYNKLQKLDKVKTEFMSIISHQLRTPLSIVKGHLSMINEGVYDDNEERKKEILNNVYDANERLIALVNDVLNISRIQSGRVEINKEETDLIDLVRKTTERMMPSADEKGINLIFHKTDEEFPKIKIDVAKIEDVVINLVDNAIKYTNKGQVEVSLKKEEDFLLIEIKDTGEGMIKDEIKKLFDTFSRGGAGKKNWIQGAGLGLYIARQFVEMHDGKVWAESEGEGKGSQFYIKLPL